ncbi:MAG: class I SAM-dependent methyltransferase [Acidibrevibacterium sp.]|uniref:class I SAM-dependent methyltransferase n=1 Tax=Acidibrevibacterium sp. TaxID=2606776 RepID=UPI003D064373
MRAVMDGFLRRMITAGQLTVRWPDGSQSRYQGKHDGPAAGLAINYPAAVRRLVLNPSLALGEAYMERQVEPLDCSLFTMLDVLVRNSETNLSAHPMMHLHTVGGWLLRRWRQFNPASRARRNVAHHYDLNGRLYSLFLDRDRQYSCAYFPTGGETLEEAQTLKKRHIAAKLKLDREGLAVLDIGSGWGGLALTLARDYGARVTGITLSSEQLHESRARAEAEGLSDRVRFELQDYRALSEPFDRIVSVGMFEHVGVDHYRQFFATVKRCLAPDGVALLHAIGRAAGPGSTNPWLAKYIFPGGYSPALSEVVPHIERAGLWITDIEILRLHYAETLRHWRRRFAANRDAIASLYDERFCRMFEFYLAGSELAFRRQDHMNFQIQMTRSPYALPIARDYMVDNERRVASETKQQA